MKRSGSRNLVVPAAGKALEVMKMEIARELGIGGANCKGTTPSHVEFAEEWASTESSSQHRSVQQHDYGSVSARETGMIGGLMTQRLIRMNKAND
jgi:hypothetical protein